MPGFSIVEFLTEQTVEVVPSNWLITDNVCWWPASTGPRLHKEITNSDSEPDIRKGMGVLYSAKILKTYENYADAKKQLPDAEFTSHLETDSDGEAKKSRKARKRKQLDEFIDVRKRFHQYEPEDSDEDSPSLLTGLRKQKDTNESSVPFFNLPASTPKKNMDKGLDESVDQTVGTDMATSGSACSCQNLCGKILEEIKNLKQEQSRFQEVILKKIVKLETDIGEQLRKLGTKDSSPNAVLDMPSFPCKTVEEMNLVESWLSNVDNVPILIQHFACIGGTCIKDTTRRILGRMFKGMVCSKINWTGKNGKHALGKTSMSKVIISSARLCHPDSTEKEIEEIVKAWFRFCKDREGGRDKRRPDGADRN